MIEDIEEFRHRYRNTIIGLRRSNKVEPIKVVNIDSRHQLIYSLISSDTEHIIDSSEVELVLDYPTLGLFNYQDGVLFISRGAGRIYKRGIQATQLHAISVPVLSIRGCITRSRTSVQGGVLTAIYNPIYVTVSSALQDLYKGEAVARAINTSYAIAALPNSPLAGVFYKQHLVGHINEEENFTLLPKYKDNKQISKQVKEILNV